MKLMRIVVPLVAAVIAGTGLALWSISEWHHALQAHQIRTCEQTYQAFIEVFTPFLPPKPTPKTTEFLETVERLKHRCSTQPNP